MKPPAAPGKIRIGTSGWTYADWRGIFYPEGLAARRWFSYYAAHFAAIEINSTFYHPPTPTTLTSWQRQAPNHFVYALKAPQALTHHRSADPFALLQSFLERSRLLGDHLGPILYQFPPWLHYELSWLHAFLDMLPTGFDHVLEFRQTGWYREEVRDLLTRRGVSFCMHDMHGSAAPLWVTGSVTYVRLHGPTANKYTGHYGPDRLRQWAIRLQDWAQSGRETYLFFNNTAQAAATVDAQKLRSLLKQE